MKKLVFIIIAILPVFLVVIIGLGSRIVSQSKHIYVESIVFVDEDENPYPENAVLKLEPNSFYQLKYVIYPLLATNKAVTFFVDDESLCTVNEEGMVVTNSEKFGSTYVTVKSKDTGIIARILIYVYSEKVQKLVLTSPSELTLSVGEKAQMEVDIIPHTAQNKTIDWSSSDEAVCQVDVNGKITAIGGGQAVITATTRDGGHSVSCTVEVLENTYIAFVKKEGDIILTNTFDLASYIEYCNPDYVDLIEYTIIKGNATIDGSIITIDQAGSVIVEIKLAVDGKTFTEDYILIKK